MRMVARNPVSSNTVTHELMMENQWIWGRGSRGKSHCGSITGGMRTITQ